MLIRLIAASGQSLRECVSILDRDGMIESVVGPSLGDLISGNATLVLSSEGVVGLNFKSTLV